MTLGISGGIQIRIIGSAGFRVAGDWTQSVIESEMGKTRILRYLNAEKKFLEYSFQSLGCHFSDRAAFNNFYLRIDSDNDKDSFLHVSSFYLFLAKNGNWIVKIEGSNPVIDYLNDAYKLVSIFSLIESLSEQNDRHQDFHGWLTSKSAKITYPLSKADISSQYQSYKKRYGSIKQCVRFFEALPNFAQSKLISSFEIRHPSQTLGIQDVAKYLYDLRSKFVHEGAPVFLTPVFTRINQKKTQLAIVRISMKDICQSFEYGLIIHFAKKHNIQFEPIGWAQFKCSAPIQNELS